MSFAGRKEVYNVESHYERIQTTRINFESADINERIRENGNVEGTIFKGVMHTYVNGEQMTAYEWEVWKYKLFVQIILPKKYPIVPSMVRVMDVSNRPIKHECFDEDTGLLSRVFDKNDRWSPAITVYSMFVAVMEILDASDLQEYEKPAEKPYVRGEYRREIRLNYDEYHLIANALGHEWLRQLEMKYAVKFELRGGKIRARSNTRHLLVMCDVTGVIPIVEGDVRQFLGQRKRRPDGVMENSYLPPKSTATSSTTTEMAGVKAQSMSEEVSGPRRVAGRGRFEIVPLPVVDTSTRPGSAGITLQEMVHQLPVTVGAPDNPPEYSSISRPEEAGDERRPRLDAVKAHLRRTADLVFEHGARKMCEVDARLSEVESRVAALETAVGIYTTVASDAFELNRRLKLGNQQRDEAEQRFRTIWTCPKCRTKERTIVPDKRVMFLECRHLYCETCAITIRTDGKCLCGSGVVNAVVVFP